MVELKKNDIVFGRTYKDVISGYVGIATGFCTYMTGCDTVLLSRNSTDENGKFQNGEWFDVERLEPVESVPDVHLRRQRQEIDMEPAFSGAGETPPETPRRG